MVAVFRSGTTTIDLVGEDASREARGVWYVGTKAWKVFAPKWSKGDKIYKASLKKNQDAITAAQKGGLPIANATTAEGTYLTSPTAPAGTPAFAVVADKLSGEFFSMQKKGGGPGKFKNLLKNIDSKPLLEKMKELCDIAVSIKLSDPQGFFDKSNTSHPMQFIDLHTGSSKAAEDMVDMIQARLDQLKKGGK